MEDSPSPDKRSVQRSGAVVHVFVLVGGIALYLLLGLALWWALNRYIDPQTPTQKRDVVQILALIMAGVAGAVGIYFTWRGQGITQQGQQISRENIETTRKTAEEQLRLTREGQFTERFPRALDQIGATDDSGSVRLEIRLGAIYEFEQIARLSRDHHWTIMQILTTYIRNNAPRRAYGGYEEEAFEEPGFLPQADIQAILTVIGRRSGYHRDVELGPIDLRDTVLREADLLGADLQGADLRNADLRNAYLREANLQEAGLREASLREADLREANLQEAYLREANLYGAKVTEEQLADTLTLQGATLPDGSQHP